MKKIWIIFIVAAVAALGTILIFKGAEIQYIFLITLDTTRADSIDYSLDDKRRTPNLARLAAEGIRFSHAYSQIPITLPAHCTMLYSQPPHTLNVYNNGQTVQASYPTVAQLLKNRHYGTGAVVSLGVLKAEFGLAKGFDRFLENFRPGTWHRSAEEVNHDAFRLIEETTARNRKQKKFFWLHYSDPHTPYSPPYYRGKLTLFLDGKQWSSYELTQEPMVKISLPLKPGAHDFSMQIDVPVEWDRESKFPIKYFEYHDFQIREPADPEDMEIRLPKTWRLQQVRGKTIYRSNATSDQILLLNHTAKPATVELSFIFKVMMGKAAQRRLYRESVAYLDRHLGYLFDFLKEKDLYDQSVFIVVGDHGEGLGEHKHYFGHIHYLNEIYVHVPLILAGKKLKQRGIRNQVVSLMDIAPTILDMADIDIPGFMQGRSLLKPGSSPRLILETYAPEAYFDSVSVMEFPYQIIYTPGRKNRKERIELIHLPTDKWGTRNTFAASDIKVKSGLLKEVMKVSKILNRDRGKPGTVPQRHRDMLKSLGYL